MTQTAAMARPSVGPEGWTTKRGDQRAWRYEGGPEGSRWEITTPLDTRGVQPPCPGTEYLAPAVVHPPAWIFHREWSTFEELPAVCPNHRVVIDSGRGTSTGRISSRMSWGEPGGLYTKGQEVFWVSTRCPDCQLAGMRPVGAAEAVFRIGGPEALERFLWPPK